MTDVSLPYQSSADTGHGKARLDPRAQSDRGTASPRRDIQK